jgi:hypothetical protein
MCTNIGCVQREAMKTWLSVDISQISKKLWLFIGKHKTYFITWRKQISVKSEQGVEKEWRKSETNSHDWVESESLGYEPPEPKTKERKSIATLQNRKRQKKHLIV